MNTRAQWSNPLLFILAAAGSAVGLGNIWKFPYMAGMNGGGAFVLIYLCCIFLIGLPIFVAELYIGQQSQANAVTAFETLHRKNTPWKTIGIMGVVTAYLIMSFYCVVGGWVLDYGWHSLLNKFASSGSEKISNNLSELLSNPWRQIFWHFIFLGITVYVVANGIKKGIEIASKILMPALSLLLLALLVRSFFLPGFSEAARFLFTPDTAKIDGKVVLEAVGQAFFTLSLGMGCMITYGSYLKKKENLFKVALAVSFVDTLIALLAGFVVFAIVFSYSFEPGGGPALIFKTLPLLFAKMPGGYFIAVAFFLLISFAALTSSFSLLEVVVAWHVEKHGLTRRQSAITGGIIIFGFGVLTSLSNNILSSVKITGYNFFDFFDKLTSSLFMPLGGIFIAVFYGWFLGPKAVQATAEKSRFLNHFYLIFLWTVRVVAPIAVAIMLVNGLRKW